MTYGDGFRVGNQVVLQYGLQRTLEHTTTYPFIYGMDSHFGEAYIYVHHLHVIQG
jgi:hypothetical protein